MTKTASPRLIASVTAIEIIELNGDDLRRDRLEVRKATLEMILAKAKLRSWRVHIIRHRREYLGTVEAPDRESAEAVAIKRFDLGQDQRRRLLIRERQ